MTREKQRTQAAHRYIESDAVDAGNEKLAFGDFINGAEWADQHPHWIPIEERLPNEEGRYIVHAERKIVSSTVCEAYYDGKFWYHHGSGAYLNVTHWMPMPQQPRKED